MKVSGITNPGVVLPLGQRVGRLLALAILAVMAHCYPVWAQQTNQPAAVPPSSETIEDVRGKMAELEKAPIPEKESLLLRELDRVDAELANIAIRRNVALYYKDGKKSLDAIADRVSKQATVIAAFDCDGNAAKYPMASQAYHRVFGELTSFYAGTDVAWEDLGLPPVRGDFKSTCQDTKDKFKSVEYSNAFKQSLEKIEKAVGDYSQSQALLADQYSKYIDVLRQRKASLQEKLNSSQSVLQITSNLPLLLAILGAACVMTILGIKLFDPELQMEWVASGQVIQFVTVMILLSVILALGLSSILKENTLGTLLGGLAGYVLAQGVGRAATRDVTRPVRAEGIAAPVSAPSGSGRPAAQGGAAASAVSEGQQER